MNSKLVNEAVDSVYKAWSVPGPSPRFHSEAKGNLRRNWPAMYNALKSLAQAISYSGQSQDTVARARCVCQHEWILSESEVVQCPNCDNHENIDIRMLRRAR